MSGYICKLNSNVERHHVRYNNRYGLSLAGDLYRAKTAMSVNSILRLL